MAKCMKCGKSTLVRGHVSLKDGAICTPCFRELGYKLTDAATSKLYTYAEITGRKQTAPSVKVANYGQARDLDCTEKEREVYDIIRSVCDDDNLDSKNIKLMRKSDSYVSAVMPSSQGYGDMDLARIKYTDRAKWIKLAPNFDKITLSSPEDVAKMAEDVRDAYRFNEPYL